MRLRLLILFFFCSILTNSFAQITFQKTYGGNNVDYAYFAQQTTDGGYFLAGRTNSSFTTFGWDVYVVKTNSVGDTLWTKTYDKGSVDDVGYAAQQTSDHGYIIAGITGTLGSGHVYVVKTDSSGNVLWVKTYGGTGEEAAKSIQQTFDGGYIISGFTSSFGAGGGYFIKINSVGNLMWSKVFDGAGGSIHQTYDGGYIIIGNAWSVGSGLDISLIKTDSIGNPVWFKIFVGTGDESGYSVQQTNDSGYIITGFTTSFGAGGEDVYLMKTDSAGAVVWSKTFGGTGNEEGVSVLQSNDGGFVVSGRTGSFGAGSIDVYLIKTDSSGGLLWSRTFGGTGADNAESLHPTTDGGYIIGAIAGDIGAGSFDAYLIKTDSLGNTGCNQTTPATITATLVTQDSTASITVSSAGTLTTNPATIVHSGGLVTTLCSFVGIYESSTDNNFSFFPNPSSSVINLEVSSLLQDEAIIISITNNLGEVMRTEKRTWKNRLSLDIKKFSTGLYFITVQNASGIWQQKFIKISN